jgi:hypothetical protein
MEKLIAEQSAFVVRKRLGGRGPDFAPSVTVAMWAKLDPSVRRCSEQLLAAQLAALREESARADHMFRNCHIDEGRAFIRAQLGAFRQAVDANRPDQAIDALGRAMASLQSFYAFSNFVELLNEQQPVWSTACEAADRPWSSEPFASVPRGRLTSDYSPSATPNLCGDIKPVLDKRGPATSAGTRQLKSWGLAAHAAAVRLALDGMASMLKQAYRDAQGFGETCGSELIFGFIPRSWWP